jgi:hypothetical protein
MTASRNGLVSSNLESQVTLTDSPSYSDDAIEEDIRVERESPIRSSTNLNIIDLDDYDDDFETSREHDNSADVPPLPLGSKQRRSSVEESEVVQMTMKIIDDCMRERLAILKAQAKRHQDFFDASIKTLHRPSRA